MYLINISTNYINYNILNDILFKIDYNINRNDDSISIFYRFVLFNKKIDLATEVDALDTLKYNIKVNDLINDLNKKYIDSVLNDSNLNGSQKSDLISKVGKIKINNGDSILSSTVSSFDLNLINNIKSFYSLIDNSYTFKVYDYDKSTNQITEVV